MQRHATSEWAGDLRSGKGSVKVGSGAFAGPYSFISRFEGGSSESRDTNPEELLGAAHAGCYSMALAHALSQAGHAVERIETKATVNLEKDAKGFSITRIDLVTRGKVAGLGAAEFQRYAEDTKQNCIVSRALGAVPMTLDAQLG
jgi:osmotically inducible protein OsmC